MFTLYVFIKFFQNDIPISMNNIPIPMRLLHPEILIFMRLFHSRILILIELFYCKIPILIRLFSIPNWPNTQMFQGKLNNNKDVSIVLLLFFILKICTILVVCFCCFSFTFSIFYLSSDS